MRGKDIDNLENILLDLEDVENGAMISLSQEEINSLESILETLKSSISKDKIESMIDKFRKVKADIFSTENVLGRASITYDIVRNDYCEKMLQELLEE